MSLALRYSATSDIGRGRYKNNQDSGFAGEHLLVVADGIGGAAGGDLASAVAVQTLRGLAREPSGDLLEALAEAVRRANDRIAELAADDPSVASMGTTLTAALFDGDQLGLAHIGDSRAYLLRSGELTQLTHDHTFVQELIDDGRISEDEARTHPHRSLLLRALDGRHESEPDLSLNPLRAGDRLLLCSDGLSGVLDESTLRTALSDGTPDSAALDLLQRALDAGGPDNITCVVAEVVDGAAPVDPESAAAAIGPLLVGAAAEQARGRLPSRNRGGAASRDTGELEPVDDDPATHRDAAADAEEQRYAPRAPKRFPSLRRLAVLVIVAAVVTAGLAAAYSWTQEQYYVKATEERVNIYQGIDADVPGISLSSLHQEGDIALRSLPGYWREQVTSGIEAENLGDAERILADLQEVAAICQPAPAALTDPTPSPSPSPSPDPSASPAQPPSATDSPRPSADPSARATTRSPVPTDDPTNDPAGETPVPTPTGPEDPECAGAVS